MHSYIFCANIHTASDMMCRFVLVNAFLEFNSFGTQTFKLKHRFEDLFADILKKETYKKYIDERNFDVLSDKTSHKYWFMC